MRRSLAVTMLTLMIVSPLLWIDDASARAGRGGSSGSRGSRTHVAPPAGPMTASHPGPAAPPVQPSSPLGGAVGGFLAGGLLGSLLFGGSGSGMGLTDLLVLLFLAALAWKMLRSGAEAAARSRGDGQAALAMGYDRPARTFAASVGGGSGEASAGPVFDPALLVEAAGDIFRQVQAAWSARDMHPIAALLTPEMLTTLQKDCDQIRAQGRVNHIEDIAIRTAELVEAWQENGQDYATLRIDASLLDYTTEDATARVVEGSRTEPVTFEEFWTFARPSWAKTWRLSAIQQPAPAAH